MQMNCLIEWPLAGSPSSFNPSFASSSPDSEHHDDFVEQVETPDLPCDGEDGVVERRQFGQAYEQGYKLTQRFLISRGAPPDAAEEVAQAAWAKGWECRQQLQNPQLLGAWVNSIAKNLLKNRVRANNRLEALSSISWMGQRGPDSLMLNQLLKWCSASEGALLRAYYIEGYTTEEIARQAGLTAVTVRVRLLRIRRALRCRLQGSDHAVRAAA